MRIITGDECGLLKESIPELSRLSAEDGVTRLGESSSPSFGNGSSSDNGDEIGGTLERTMSRTRGVVDMAFCHTETGSSSLAFCALRADGSVERWEGSAPCETAEDRICGGRYVLSKSWSGVFASDNDDGKDVKDGAALGIPVAMCSAQKYQHSGDGDENGHGGVLACCTSAGWLSLLHPEKGVVARYHAYGGGGGATTAISLTKGQFDNRHIVTAADMDYDGARIAVGGRERSANLLDVETGKVLWKAKNLPPNRQTLLQQPIWSTTIKFLDPSSTTPISSSSSNLLAIGTAYKQLQIYDVRLSSATSNNSSQSQQQQPQRRPVLYTPEWNSHNAKSNIFNHRLTSLAQIDANRIVAGDAAGYVAALDLRKIPSSSSSSPSASRRAAAAAHVGRFNGPAGSVRQIVKHRTLPVIACVGLDRMLTTFDCHTRKQLDCVYLKQRLNCALICEDGFAATGAADDEENKVDEENNGHSFENGMRNDALMDDGDINAEDEVQDYVDSSEEEGVDRKLISNGNHDDDDDDEDSDDDDETDSLSEEEASSEESDSSENLRNAKRRRK